MTEKSPKRGILSSLMGLFGDDAQAEAEAEREAAAHGAGEEATQNAPASTAVGEWPAATTLGENGPGTNTMGENVVRESYEPGWYAVSTARTSRPSFVSEPWGGVGERPEEPRAEQASVAPVTADPVSEESSEASPADEPTAPPADAAGDDLGVTAPIYTEPYRSSEATAPEPGAGFDPGYGWYHEPVAEPAGPEPEETEPASPADHAAEPPWAATPAADHAAEPPWAATPAADHAEEPPWAATPAADHAEEPPWAATPAADHAEEPPWAATPAAATWNPFEQQDPSEQDTTPVSQWPRDDAVTATPFDESEPDQHVPAVEDIPQPWSYQVAEDVARSWSDQVIEDAAMPEPVTEPWSEPVTEPWSEPVTETEPEAEVPSVEAETADEFAPVESAAEPTLESESEPVVESEAEPVMSEPEAVMSEPEPVVMSEPEPVVVSEPEPVVVSEPQMAVDQAPEADPVIEAEPVAELATEAEHADETEMSDEPASVTTVDEEPAAQESAPDVHAEADFVDDVSVDDVSDEREPVEETTMPAPEPELATVPAAPAPEGNAGLQSRVATDRRRALEELVARGMTDDDVPAVAGLLQDPERAIRLAALAALESRADSVDAAAVRQALRDPSDEVRAAAVRLAAARTKQDVPEAFAMIAERQWPATQQAALEAVPRTVASFGIGDDDLASVLRAVAGIDTEANAAERSGFSALAAAVGTGRLADALDAMDDRRVGAARLLLQEGSPESLRALASYARDPEPEVARLGHAAFDRLGPEQEEPVRAEHEPEQTVEADEQTVETFEAELGPQGEMVSGLARALGDPDEAVRVRATEALRAIQRDTLINWALVAMGSNDPLQVELGAQVAEAAGLTETAGELLARGAAVSVEDRGPFARALASFSLTPEQMVELVDGVDSQHKPDAVRMLWHVGGRALLPAVQPLLHDSSAAVRVAALEVFGESGDPATIEVAQGVLEGDSSPVVRATAISVIGRAGLDQRAASLARALADPDPDVRATAVEVLPAGMGRQAAELLLEALGDEDERVWQAAIRHLAAVPDRDRSIVWQAIERCPANRREHLVATLERSSAERLAMLALDHMPSPDAAERTLAITLAGRAGTPECVRGIVQALQDPAPTVRRTAASALLTLRSGESIQGLTRALSDPDVEVRVEAVRALSVIDDDNVLDSLITALKDPEMRVRDVAGEALVRWRSPAVARRLALALTNPSLRRPSGEVLARMGDSAVDPLVDILMEDDSELAGTVGHLLESLVGPDVFLTRLGSMDPNDRLRAVEALGAIRGERGVDGLSRALSDPVEPIRVRAVTLLGEIGDERAFEAVKQAFLSDPVLEVVTAAEEALKRLQGPTGTGAS